ncbi:MAG: hypothetical protein RIQ79_2017 [Verrucomicrobiota bacterium]|jgi:hypothetical protein
MPPIKPETLFTRANDFESRVAELEFPPDVWAVFSLLDHPSCARDIAAALLTPVSAVLQALERLSEASVIQPKAIGWTEFAKRAKTPAPAHAVTRAAGDAIVAIRVSPPITRTPSLVALRIGTPRPAAPAKPPRAWKLRPILDAISAAAGGGLQGQLLLLKIFLHIPPEILKASGIESVAAIGADFEFTDPRLRDTLLEIGRTSAKVDLAPYLAD